MGTEGPVYESGNFTYASRTVSYARGGYSDVVPIQTNITNGFSGAPIPALFERTNAVLQTAEGPVPYSSKIYLHRMLPEITGTGKVSISVGGANSIAQTPTYGTSVSMQIVTDNPWVTTQQNAVRTAAIKVESNDSTDTWNMPAMNWQATVVEDAF